MKMRYVNYIGFLSILFLLSCNTNSKENSSEVIVPAGYELVWSDEFSADGKPNDEYWNYEEGFVRNRELQWYNPDNVFIKDGLLIFEARRERYNNPNFSPMSDNWRYQREYIDYTSGLIKTNGKFSFQYGILEVRARIDTQKGSWPAIWTLGNDRRWPLCGEIDILEYYQVDDEPTILANAAWSNDQSWNAVWDSKLISLSEFLIEDPDWADKFHVWKMDWTEDYIRLYLDDLLLNEIDLSKAIHSDDNFNPFHQPHYILLNLAIGSNGGSPQQSEFPIYYEVDYVRVFQKKE